MVLGVDVVVVLTQNVRVLHIGRSAFQAVQAQQAQAENILADGCFVFVRGEFRRLTLEVAEIVAGAQAEMGRIADLGGAVAAATARGVVAAPMLVMDVGGGSTELFVGEDAASARGVSLDMGSVRIRERFLHSDPPTAEEIAAQLGLNKNTVMTRLFRARNQIKEAMEAAVQQRGHTNG